MKKGRRCWEERLFHAWGSTFSIPKSSPPDSAWRGSLRLRMALKTRVTILPPPRGGGLGMITARPDGPAFASSLKINYYFRGVPPPPPPPPGIPQFHAFHLPKNSIQ